MAKLKVSAELVSECLFRDMDRRPVICDASWEDNFMILDIVGDGVPKTDGFVEAIITERPRITIEFKELKCKSDEHGPDIP